ncbi:hypothetical protein [Hymenobacter metallilatus]|uniref:Uncharacterized protein n=1 Tax=Hymenobacter metallilatus TaxID=2493666 RepID=A0A3R9MKX0_9BACT|nr:hypothetical protein [Hymenobacter metallilatus]RSK23949.1 hypothetical protein EI290_21415 [Hymenobacter metallilatus]
MKTIHQQITQSTQDVEGAFEANYFPRQIAAYQQSLRTLMALWDQLLLAQAEGITEITVRSRSISITMGISTDVGATVAQDLYESLGNDAHRTARLIAESHATLAKDGESAERLHLLGLLLTPVGSTGHALPDSGTAGPFLTDTPASKAKRRPAA